LFGRQRILIRSLKGIDLNEKRAISVFSCDSFIMPKRWSPVSFDFAIGMHDDFSHFYFDIFQSQTQPLWPPLLYFSHAGRFKLEPNLARL
jgi:hypothetical protein